MKPLVICDCDEVLLHFVTPFEAYLRDRHDLSLSLDSFALTGNVRRGDGSAVEASDFPGLLDGFFEAHMPTQTPAPGAVAALARLAETADIVVLTNIADRHAVTRTGELARLGMPYRVIGNTGPKGPAVAALIDQYGPTRTIFVDDLPPHHKSVAASAPETWRLHMVAEPRLQALIPAASHAHARIDDWSQALPRILAAMES